LAERAGAHASLDGVFPTAELLVEPWRETIERSFGARALPYYGCGEVNSLGYSCPEGPGYHTCDEHSIIEVERDNGDTALQGEGAFLITDLDNLAMPLIRYRNGDAGEVAGAGCGCGRSLGRILRLGGRVNDVLVTTTGVRFSGAIGAHAFKLVEHVESFQIVQRAPGRVTIRIVRAPGYDAGTAEPTLRRIFTAHLGEGSGVEFDYVSSIAKTPAGKARFVINEYLASRAATTSRIRRAPGQSSICPTD
jgi:phenylacetate-CoA ligase